MPIQRDLPSVVATRPLASTKLFDISEAVVRFAGGVERRLERITNRSGPTVLIVPILGERLILISEYCAGSQRYELGFPTGTLERGESIEEAADRELREEVGFGARRLSVLATFKVYPGHFDHQTHVVLAEDLVPESLPGDEPEPLGVLQASMTEIDEFLGSGELNEARSVAAILLLERRLRRRNMDLR